MKTVIERLTDEYKIDGKHLKQWVSRELNINSADILAIYFDAISDGDLRVTVQKFEERPFKNDYSFRDFQHQSSDGAVYKLREMSTRHLKNCWHKYGDEEYRMELEFREQLNEVATNDSD